MEPIVVAGIGAAAGGREALRALISGISPGAPLALVVVHPARGQGEDLLAGQASSWPGSPLELVPAKDGTRLRQGVVHVVPAGHAARLESGVLLVERARELPEGAGPIDGFLQSLAIEVGPRAVGVVLSGTGTDGALGLRAVSRAGGLSIAQDPATARSAEMPSSAVAADAVDRVLEPQAIGRELDALARRVLARAVDGCQATDQEIERVIPDVVRELERHTEHDFSHYKSGTIVRRIRRRMQMCQVQRAAEYCALVQRSPEEARALFRDLLISVTAFFRDAHSFEELSRAVLGPLVRGRAATETVRVWVPGCATGEEAYSIAMLLLEHMDAVGLPPRVQIFATDIDEKALQKARQGLYPASIVDQVSQERLERFFERKDLQYKVAGRVRDLVHFSAHNLVTDPPFSRLDLISCRNVLIYMSTQLQRRLVPILHHALRPGGYLFLGPSESLETHRELFRAVDNQSRISQRLPSPLSRPSAQAAEWPACVPGAAPASREESDLPDIVQGILLGDFAPRAVAVDDEGRILYATGDMGRYLELGAGRYENDVVQLARSELRMGLRAAYSEARHTGRAVAREGLSIPTGGGLQRIRIDVQPLPPPGSRPARFLIVFSEVGPELRRPEADSGQHEPGGPAELAVELERELDALRADLERGMHELETANEELRSSNEELLSMNEELQSTNEELEISKDEIQAGNDALRRAHGDLENLLRSTEIATVFLGDDLTVKSFTPAATRLFNLMPGDVGRPLAHITHTAHHMPPLPAPDELEGSSGPIEHEVRTRDGGWYVRRVLPYRDPAGLRHGMVITFLDVAQLRRTEQRLRSAAYAADVGTWRVDLATGLDTRDANLNRMLGLEAEDSTQPVEDLFERIHPEDRSRMDGVWTELLASGGSFEFDIELRLRRADGTYGWFRNHGRLLTHAAGELRVATGAMTDITSRLETEEKLYRAVDLQGLALQAARLGAFDLDLPTGELELDERCRELLGLSRDEPLTAETFGAHIHPEDGERWRQQILRGERAGGDARSTGAETEYEYRVWLPDGATRWLLVRSLTSFRADGALQRPVRHSGIVMDVTERKLAETRLRVMDQRKDEFLAILGHELRNPLAALANATQLLQEGGVEGEEKAWTHTMMADQVRQLASLVDDLLDMTRISSGKIVLRRRDVALGSVIATAVESARPAIDQREHSLEVVDDSGGIDVHVDATRLEQVLVNLLVNAAKYTPRGGNVRLEVRHEPDDLRIAVVDDGVGLSRDALEHIFEPFAQIRRRGAAHGGLGIGLTLVRQLVALHGGRVEVQSPGTNQGSRFTVVLPWSEIQARKTSPPGPPPARGSSLSGLRVLVVDDNVDASLGLSKLLERRGVAASTAASGEVGLELARRERPDIVLLDLGLPDRSGFEVAADLRAAPGLEHLLLIALTGFGDDKTRQEVQAAGFDDHLLKPVDVDALVELLARRTAG